MPSPLHPDHTFTIDVDEDAPDLPDDQHRRFRFSYGSSAFYMEVEDLLDDPRRLTARTVHEALAKRLANPEDDKRLAEDLTPSEKVSVLVKLDLMQSLSEAQAKKSKPLSPSSKASSAPDATLDPTAAAAS